MIREKADQSAQTRPAAFDRRDELLEQREHLEAQRDEELKPYEENERKLLEIRSMQSAIIAPMLKREEEINDSIEPKAASLLDVFKTYEKLSGLRLIFEIGFPILLSLVALWASFFA